MSGILPKTCFIETINQSIKIVRYKFNIFTCGQYANAEHSVNIFTLPFHTCKIPTVCTIFSAGWQIETPFLNKWIYLRLWICKKDSIYWCPNLLQFLKFLGKKDKILLVGMERATNSCCQKHIKNGKMHFFIKKHTYQHIKFSLSNYHCSSSYCWNFSCGLCNHNKGLHLHSFRKKNHMKKSSLTYVWISWHQVKMTVHWN